MADDDSLDHDPTRREIADTPSSGADDLDFGAALRGLTAGQRVFDRYTLTKTLGRGGMGWVWLAHDEKLERDVALKFLPGLVALDQRAVDDLKRETGRVLNLTHPHIVRIHDFVDDAQSAAIAMEWVDGPSLSKLVLDYEDRVFPLEQLTPWVAQLCSALEYAHTKAKVMHRDLRPANLMIDVGGDLKITDFGISAILSDSTKRVSKQTGASGMPFYMSPQQMMGEKPAVTDDIYALGATLYELLTGKPPFYSGQVQLQVMQKTAPGIAERRAELNVRNTNIVPKGWEETIAVCLAKEPGDRPQMAREVAERLLGAAVPSPKTKVEGPGTTQIEKPAVAEVMADMEGGSVAGNTELAGNSQDTKQEKAGSHRRADRVGASLDNAREARGASETRRASTSNAPFPKSKIPLMLGITVAGAVLATAGWWFGFEQPRRAALEAERVAAARAAAEAEAARLARELAEAEAEAARIANARGGIIITTEPAGADVLVGGFAREKTPVTLMDVRLGTYPVVVTLDGYEEQRLETEVMENEFATLNLELVRSTGALSIASNPPGLEVTVEPAPGVGGRTQTVQTPARLDELPTGGYTLTYRRENWPDQTKEVRVVRNDTAFGLAEFIGGRLSITSTPSGAEVWAEGRRLGITPLDFNDLMPGRFELEFRLADHQTTTRQGQVRTRETTSIAATLEEILAPRPSEPFENTLGMKFVPVLGSDVLFSIWETRVRDFAAFVKETDYDWAEDPGFPQGPTHPVVKINEADAKAFCAWLTKREQAAGRLASYQEYRLPTDAEWDAAVGKTRFPWGDAWPPPRGAGNYGRDAAYQPGSITSSYGDGHHATAPVGSFNANQHSIYDLGGNVWERVEGRTNGIRGASFNDDDDFMLASHAFRLEGGKRSSVIGFRVVCVVGSVR